MSEFAKDGLMIAGIALGLVAAVALALRRRQERSILEGWAARHGWSQEDPVDLARILGAASLMQIGHSRRFSAVVGDPQGVRLFEYACEIGFEHERTTHRWIGVVVPVEHTLSRAIITCEPWVFAAAAHPAFTRLPLGSPGDEAIAGEARGAILEDSLEWSRGLEGELGRKLADEPLGRTWEVLPGAVVGHQAAPIDSEKVGELVSAGKEIAKQL